MYISSVHVRNFKSFFDSGKIDFDHGVNIIIGPNSAGKTALLEVLGLHTQHDPHFSKKSKPTRDSKVDESSFIEVAVTISGDEFKSICSNQDEDLYFPAFDDHDQRLEQFKASLKSGITIRGRVGPEGFVQSSFDYGYSRRSDKLNKVTLNDTGEFEFVRVEGNASNEFGNKVLRKFRQGIYRFHAERPNVGRSVIGMSSELNPDASNLAEVLHVLETKNLPRFKILNRLLTKIFPFIAGIAVPMEQGHEAGSGKVFEIKVWPDDEREDLVIPLNKCGTGIGQALAILYILVNSTTPRTIIIDEPQSFLHPGAAKELIKIVNEHREHQYFISTHSPEILATAKTATVNVLKYENGESAVRSLNRDQSNEMRKVFDQLGVDFSIFFSTKVLWVEGPTEEKAFPLVIEKYLGTEFLSDLTLQALADTGSLQAKKNARAMFEIYRRLSGQNALVPPIAAVVLDGENREDRLIREMQTTGGDLLYFLPRKCYENYLLDPEAIAHIANEQDNFAEQPITPAQVAHLIKQLRLSGIFLPDQAKAREADWLRRVDAAKLLKRLFSELSSQRISYVKTVHSPEITRWLLEHDRGDLREVAEIIQSAMNP